MREAYGQDAIPHSRPRDKLHDAREHLCMPRRIGPKRLKRLLDRGVNLSMLPPRDQFEACATMARILYFPPPCMPKRDRPRCGAQCRDGHRCQARAVWDAETDAPRNGRCRLHGGVSTGLRTPEGRRRIGEAARQRAVRAEALATYAHALATYKTLRESPMPGFPGLKALCTKSVSGQCFFVQSRAF